MSRMRIALVSPYSWTYPGGVTRHIEALAAELFAAGHEVRVLAPFDVDDRRAALLHRGMRPQRREVPEWLVPLGPTLGWGTNGAVSNLSHTPYAVSTLRRELKAGRFDVVHVHEPVTPVVGWDALTSTDAPLVGTFHCYSEHVAPHMVATLLGARRKLNHLAVRIAVSDAAAWTGRRFYGGAYRIVPNGVAIPSGGVPALRERRPWEPLRIAFVGQAVERKGLPVLLRAFEALRAQVPAELVVVGATAADVAPLLEDTAGVSLLGPVGDEEKHAALVGADVLAAPSLGGESFGMVLTEAFAAGTPVVASDIAGYRDVVSDGRDGLLVPRGDATALAEALRGLALEPRRTRALGAAAAVTAERYAWPVVAERVVDAYEAAVGVPQPEDVVDRAAVRIGLRSADLGPRRPARRLPSLEPAPAPGRRIGQIGRRVGLALGAAAMLGGSYVALERIGLDPIGRALGSSSPAWVLVALALMCLSMGFRAVSWLAILKAALPTARPRFADAMQGTAIGVLMSADAARPARRAVARPDRRPPARRAAAVPARRARHARVPDAAQRRRAADPRRRDVHHRRPLRRPPAGAGVVRARAVRRAVRGPVRPRAPSRRPAARSASIAPLGRAGPRRAAHVRSGLAVFRRPRLGAGATVMQLGAWALQWLSCYVLLVALGLEHHADLGAAAAVLFAVNVSAVLPLTPSNLGVFQAACVAVLAGAYGIPAADALGYGIILQAVEIATAVIIGAPALVKEGVSWREVRLRALHSAPVHLSAPPRHAREIEA